MTGVEGVPAVFGSLQANLKRNGLSSSTDYRLGLAGRRDGSAKISVGRHRARNRLGARSGAGWFEPKAEIPFVDLDSIVAPGERIALIKCDIEGAEQMFIEAYPSILARTEALVIEFHHGFCDVPRCRELISAARLVLVHEQSAQHGQTVAYYRRATQ